MLGTVAEPLRPTFQLLQSLPPLTACPAPAVASLCLFSSRHSYPPGATLVRQGQPVEALLVLVSGQCKLVRSAQVQLDGATALDTRRVTYHTELALVGPCAMLCEDTVLQQRPASDTVVATVPTEAVWVDGAEVRRQFLLEGKRGAVAERLAAAAAAEHTWRGHRHQLLLSQRVCSAEQLTPQAQAETEHAHKAFDQAWGGGAAAINTESARRPAAPASALQWGGLDLQALQAAFQPPATTSRLSRTPRLEPAESMLDAMATTSGLRFLSKSTLPAPCVKLKHVPLRNLMGRTAPWDERARRPGSASSRTAATLAPTTLYAETSVFANIGQFVNSRPFSAPAPTRPRCMHVHPSLCLS